MHYNHLRHANLTTVFFISWGSGLRALSIHSQIIDFIYSFFLLACLSQLRSQRLTFENEFIIEASRRSYPSISIPIQSHYLKDLRPQAIFY